MDKQTNIVKSIEIKINSNLIVIINIHLNNHKLLEYGYLNRDLKLQIILNIYN